MVGGELELTLPTGLVRIDGVVTKHPNVEVQDRIDLIFATFFQQKSVAQTVRWFIKNDLLLPRLDRHGDIQWKRVTAASVSSFLNNPAYAHGRCLWADTLEKVRKHGQNAGNQPATQPVAVLCARQVPAVYLVGNVRKDSNDAE